MQREKNKKLKHFSSLVSLTLHFTKFIVLEQLTAMPQFNVQNVFLFFFCCCFCFLSSHHDTNPLLHLYHFRKKNILIYWLILTMNHQGSYFPFFLSISSGSNMFVPQQILYPFEAQCLIINNKRPRIAHLSILAKSQTFNFEI